MPPQLVMKAFEHWRARDQAGFPPHIGMIAREGKKILFPALARPWGDASELDSLWRKARRIAGLDKQNKSSWIAGMTTEEHTRRTREMEKVYERLQEEHFSKTTNELIELVMMSPGYSATYEHLKNCGVDFRGLIKNPERKASVPRLADNNAPRTETYLRNDRTMTRLSESAESEVEEKMRAQGYKKVQVDLPGNRKGFVWERFRPQTAPELAAAKAGCAKPQDIPASLKTPSPIAQGLNETIDWATVIKNIPRVAAGHYPLPLASDAVAGIDGRISRMPLNPLPSNEAPELGPDIYEEEIIALRAAQALESPSSTPPVDADRFWPRNSSPEGVSRGDKSEI